MVPPSSRGITRKKKLKLVYPNIPTAFRPLPHGEGHPIPTNGMSFLVGIDVHEWTSIPTVFSRAHQLDGYQDGSADVVASKPTNRFIHDYHCLS